MVLIDAAIQAFVIIAPVWFVVSFALFVTREEQSKSTVKSFADTNGESEIASPIVESANATAVESKNEDEFKSCSTALGNEAVNLALSKSNLTIWKCRKQQVVPTKCINETIPDSVQRRRWRGTEVVLLADLEAIWAIT